VVILSFVNALKRTMTIPLSLPTWLAPARTAAVSAAPSRPRKLPQLLLAHARLGGPQKEICPYNRDAWLEDDPREFKLFVEEIGPDQIEFRSRRSLEPGTSLQLDLLLPGFGPYRATATVSWILGSASGFRGQATLEASPADADKLRLFFDLDWARGR
jgi:hypothetical protein